MPRISSDTIEKVNNSTDIVALVGEYTKLTQRGNEWWGCCPFHHEKTPSFHVVPERKMCHCFGCGAGGGVINFFMEMEKYSFMEAVEILAKKAGIEVIYEGSAEYVPQKNNQREEYINLYNRTADLFRFFLTQSEMGKTALNYLKERGVSQEIAEQFKLGYAPKDRRWLKQFLLSKNFSNDFLNNSGLFSQKYPDVAFFSDRLMFPIFDRNGNVVAFGGRILSGDGPKYINTKETDTYKKGLTLYGFNFARAEIRSKKSVIICEGNMDVIAYHQAGISNAVAPLGTAFTEDQAKMLSGFIDTVYLSFDSDSAGQKATVKAILMCRKLGLSVKIIRITGGKDPSEILLKFGSEALTNMVSHAIIDFDFLLYKLRQEYPVDKPEGKIRACLEIFPYIDALQSDIQKESCLEQLAQFFALKVENVKSDYLNRKDAEERSQVTDRESKANINRDIKLDAELRAVLAVTVNLKYFKLMRSQLSADDFENENAKELFIMLEECFREGVESSDNILSKCSSPGLKKLITEAFMSGEFSGEENKVELAVTQSINTLKKNSLVRQSDRLLNKIRSFTANTPEENRILADMLSEKMSIDSELLRYKDKN